MTKVEESGGYQVWRKRVRCESWERQRKGRKWGKLRLAASLRQPNERMGIGEKLSKGKSTRVRLQGNDRAKEKGKPREGLEA